MHRMPDTLRGETVYSFRKSIGKRVFDKRECEVSLVDLCSGVEVADGGGRTSSSIDVSRGEVCEMYFVLQFIVKTSVDKFTTSSKEWESEKGG